MYDRDLYDPDVSEIATPTTHGQTVWNWVTPDDPAFASKNEKALPNRLSVLSPEGRMRVERRAEEDAETIDGLMAKYGFNPDGSRWRPFPNNQPNQGDEQ